MCVTCGCDRVDVTMPTHLVRIERDVLSKNERIASDNRRRLEAGRVVAFNVVSSPGAGKTRLLERIIHELGAHTHIRVIEGDQATSADADRIRSAGAPAVQVNTGTGCHLDAEMISKALPLLEPPHGALLFIENVGNLVCPALFDLGERAKIVIISVTEGEDKPLKYPHMFRASRLMVVNKIDLLPHVDVNLDLMVHNARRANPEIEVIAVSAQRGDGIPALSGWLRRELEKA